MDKKKPLSPKSPKSPRSMQLPVDVRSYYKKGKRIKGYKRLKPGEKKTEREDQKK